MILPEEHLDMDTVGVFEREDSAVVAVDDRRVLDAEALEVGLRRLSRRGCRP